MKADKIISEAFGKRNVSMKCLEYTHRDLDEFMTSGDSERPWESFELTQGKDVRAWIDNPKEMSPHLPNISDLKDIIIPAFEKPVSILDVGCYGGYLYDYLKTNAPGRIAHYTGVDIQPSVIEAARLIHGDIPDATFEVGDALELSECFGPRSFDIVCCYRVTIHLPYFKKILSNLLRVADGIVHLVLFIQDYDWCRRFEETDLDTGKKVIYYQRFISEATIKDCIAGLPVSYKIIPGPVYASLIMNLKGELT